MSVSSNGYRRRRRRPRRPATVPVASAVVVVSVVVACAPLYLNGSGSTSENATLSASPLASQVGAAFPSTSTPAEQAPPPALTPTTAPSVPAPAPPGSAPTVSSPATAAGNPFAGAAFYDSPDTDADRAVAELRLSRPADAATLEKISETPAALWVGDWLGTGQVRAAVANYVGAARAAGAVPVLVVYAIPQRDCGGYSAGGMSSPDVYRGWVAQVAAGLGGGRAAVVVEPDAIAGADCLGQADAQTRYALLRDAGAALTAAGATVYLDAGNSGWLSAAEAANRLRQAGVAAVRGFALNTSNYRTTSDSVSYGSEVARLLGGGRFVVDTSRNGLGPAPGSAWCNPAGRALGVRPTTATGNANADAFLWLKGPGESDGTCNGGPPAGQFWVDYALGLAGRAAW